MHVDLGHDHDRPYSAASRGVRVGRLDSQFGYAFNSAEPTGVTLLTRKAANRLSEIISGESSHADAPHIDSQLAAKGLIPGFSTTKLTPEKKLGIWLHLINGCNFSCSYCYIPHLRKVVDQRQLSQFLLSDSDSEILVQRLVDAAKDLCLDRIQVTFAGGEPTLAISEVDRFATSLSASCSIPVSYGMISNGSFDSKDTIPVLKKHNIRVSLSVDGLEDRHNSYRFELKNKNRIGSWRSLWSNVDRLQANYIDPYFLFTVTNKNYHDLDEFSELCHSRKLGYRLSLVRRKRLPAEDARENLAQGLRGHYERLGENLSPDLPISRFAKFAEWDLSKKKKLACSSCSSYMSVDNKLQAASCQMNMGKPAGNLEADEFEVVLQRFRARDDTRIMAEPNRREGPCTRCQFFHVCAGGCPQHTLQAKKNLETVSPWCSVYGELVPVYIRAIANQMRRRVVGL